MVDKLQRNVVQGQVINRANTAQMASNALREGQRQSNQQAEQIVSNLSRFTSIAGDVGIREAQRKIETDKVAGTNAAIRGQDLDDGSSRTKRTAYNLVNARKDLATANSAIKDNLNKSPMMEDADYDRLSTTQYDGLLAKYQDEPEIMKFLSVSAQESQLEMYSYRKETQNKHKLEEDRTILSDRLTELSIGTDPAFIAEDVAEWEQEAQALGYSTDDSREIMASQAQAFATAGDDGLLSYLETQDWASQNGNLKIARTAYNNVKTQEDFTGQADALNAINTLVGDPAQSWEKIEAMAVATNAKYPNTYSGKQLAVLHAKHDKDQKEANDLRAGSVQSFDRNYIGLAKDGTLTDADRKARIKDVEAVFAAKSERMEPADLIKQQLAWSQHNEVKLPSLTTKFAAIPLLVADRELTDADNLSIELLSTAREQDIDFYISGRTDAEYAKNIRLEYNQTKDATAAILSATNLRDNRFKVDEAVKSTVRSEFDEAVSEQFNNYFAEDVPEWNRNWIVNEEMNNINTRLYNSANPTQLGERQAELMKSKYTQLPDGTVGNYDIGTLYNDLGYDSTATPEVVKQTMMDAKEAIAGKYADLGIKKEDFFIIKTEGGYAVRTSDEFFNDDQLFDGASIRLLGDAQKSRRLNLIKPVNTQERADSVVNTLNNSSLF